MIDLLQQLLATGSQFLQNIIKFAEPFLQNLDPSLFQNITLGILAIFIPILVVFLSEKNDDFLKRESIKKEVLKIDKVFWFSITSIFLFAIYNHIYLWTKLFVLIIIFILTFLLTRIFLGLLNFSKRDIFEYEKSFLEKLNVNKDDELQEVYSSLWQRENIINFNERAYTKIFISHIDEAIINKKFELAVVISQLYLKNIEKRNHFLLGSDILPKVLEWHSILWKEEQDYIHGRYPEKKGDFWNWNYFGREFFQAITKILLKGGHTPYQLFSVFKEYIDESMEKLNKIKDEKEKKKYDRYITRLFANFCPTFFNEIDSAPSNYDIWEHCFPAEWKISMENAKSGIPRVILHEFLQWSRDRIFKKDRKKDFDKDLTEVINGIFPNVHSSLFTAFLMLFFSTEVKYALEKEPNFYILGTSALWIGSAEESKEERDKRLAEMMREKETSQKEETIQIILNFFHFWQKLKIYKDDLSKEEFENWESLKEEKRKMIVKRVRKDKLEKLKAEIESDEVKKICKDDERKELYRKDFLELIKLLLQEI